MQLFLVNQSARSQPALKKLTLIAGLGLSAVYVIYRIFTSTDQSQDDQQPVERVDKPAGIYNQGNTCFVNSLLQALSSLSQFQQNISQAVKSYRKHTKNEQLIVQLQRVIKKINSNSQSIDIVHFLSLMGQVKEGLINFQQQDAHQLFVAITSCFEQTLKKQKKMDLSASIRSSQELEVQNYFIGYTKSSIVCTSCRSETTIKIQPFSDLSLEIRDRHIFDIKSALKQYQKQEVIENWVCTKCSIRSHIARLKRAVSKLKGQNKSKLEFVAKAIIQYLQNQSHSQLQMSQINKNLASFVLSFQNQYNKMSQDPERDTIFVELQKKQSTIIKKTAITKYPKIFVIHLKQLVVNPLTGYPQLLRKFVGFDQQLNIERKAGQKQYRLMSLLTHFGTESMGHYFTFRRKNYESEKWYVISDSHSKPCDWSHVKSSKAYMLFYQLMQ